MSVKKRVQEKKAESSLFSIIGYKYMPYWPLFLLLSVLLLMLAFFYTRYITPVYDVSATLVINDEQKGVQESETLRSLNVYAANKIVENEVEVLTSRTLMKEVVLNLHLYAPVFEVGRVKPSSAYVTSPIKVQAQDPARLKPQKMVPFEYNAGTERVQIGGRHYPLYEWISFPYGIIRFVKNEDQKRNSVRPLYFSLVDPRVMATGMGGSLEVGAGSKLSSVVNINYTDEVPERGEDVVNHLLEAYSRASVENNNQLAANTLSFVSERIRHVEGELDSIEQRIQQYKSQQGIVDLSQQGRLYLESVAENDRKAADINTQLAVLNQVEQYVRSGNNRTGIIPTTLGISDPVLADLLQKLNELELQYANMRARIGEENPMVKSVENEIGKIRPNILGIVSSQRAQMQASLANYRGSSGQVNAMLKTIPQKERQLVDISRQQAIKNEVYAFLLQRREEAELSNASTIADSRIVDRAEASIEPKSSKRMIVLLGALIVAFAIAIGFIFLKEGLTGKVLFRSDITKATSIPVVAEIAYRKNASKRLKPLAADPVLAAQFLQLQAALGLYNGAQKKQKILITSSIANEGKTFVANGLAASLAAAEQKVVLIDVNLHQPETTIRHDLQQEQGLVDFIHGGSELSAVIKNTGVRYLDIIPAGVKSKNAAAILLNERLPQLLQQLEKLYDYIIMDASASEFTTDAFILAPYADTTLYMVRHGATPSTIVQKLEGNQKLQSVSGVSIVFNGIKGRGFLRRYYGYGYGYGTENVFSKKTYVVAE